MSTATVQCLDSASARAALARIKPTRLLSVALRRVDDRADAEDLVQRTFVRALTGLHSYRGNAPLWHWVRQILWNEIVDHRHDLQRAATVPLCQGTFAHAEPSFRLSSGELWNDTPFDLCMRDELIERLQTGLDALPEPTRTVLKLRYLESATVSDIAERTHLTEPAITARLRRGKRQLRRLCFGAYR